MFILGSPHSEIRNGCYFYFTSASICKIATTKEKNTKPSSPKYESFFHLSLLSVLEALNVVESNLLKKRAPKDNSKSPGAFILDPSGKPIS